jgi:phage tail protein X
MNRYQNIPKSKINGKEVYVTSRYPEVPLSEEDIYVYTTQGDRFDTLAQQYYNDSSLWWIISIANTDQLSQNTLVIPAGLQIRIPNNPSDIIRNFNLINS